MAQIAAQFVRKATTAQGTAAGVVEVVSTTGFVVGAKVSINAAGGGIEAFIVQVVDEFNLVLRAYDLPAAQSGSTMVAYPSGSTVVQEAQMVAERYPLGSTFSPREPFSVLPTYQAVQPYSTVLTENGGVGYVHVADSSYFFVGTEVTLTSTAPLSAIHLKITRIEDGRLYLTDLATGLPFDATAFITDEVATISNVFQYLAHNSTLDLRAPPLTGYEMTAISAAMGTAAGIGPTSFGAAMPPHGAALGGQVVVLGDPPTLTVGTFGALTVDTTGALRVAGSFAGVIQGTKTPTDTYANPTDASDSLSLTMGWDEVASRWKRIRTTVDGILLVGGHETPADAYPNTTDAVDVLGLSMGWNGATWDRLRSTVANGLQVDVTRVQGTVEVTQGTSPWAVSVAALPLPAGAATQATLANLDGTATSILSKLNATLAVTQSGTWDVNVTGTVNQGTAGATPWPVEVVNGSLISTGNSTTTPLAGADSFTGTAVDTLGYASISFSIQSDVVSAVGGVLAQWSHDNINWFGWTGDSFASDRIGTGKGMDGLVRVHARYFRIKYINGATPQTYFRLQVILHKEVTQGDTIGVAHSLSDGDDAIITKSVLTGRSTTPQGAVSYTDIKAFASGALGVGILDTRNTGFGSRMSPIGDLQVAQPLRLCGAGFATSTLDTSFWTSTPVGSGSVVVANSVATLTTGVTANSASVLTSVRKARFMFAHANLFRAAVRTPDTGTANNTRRVAAFDGVDGLGFVIQGTTFGICYQKAGGGWVDVVSGFNGDWGSVYNWTSNFHALEVVYFTAGTWWFVDGILLHAILPTTTPTVGSLSLPVYLSNVNSNGATANITLDVWNASILRLGNSMPRPQFAHINTNTTTTLKRGPGTLSRIVVNSPGGNNNTYTIYDSLSGSGSVIAVISTASAAVGQVLTYDLDFFNGLTIISATGTAADVTVVFD